MSRNIENLKPILTSEEAKKRGRAGGLASGEARRERASLKETFKTVLASEVDTKSHGTVSAAEAVALAMIKEAMHGNVRAAEFIRDTIGERPDITAKVAHREEPPQNNEVQELIACIRDAKN